MLYRKFLNKLQKFIRKQGFWRTRVLLAVLLGITLLFILPARSQQPVTLNMLMSASNAQSWRPGMVKYFEAENPGIRINIIEGPNATNLREDLYTSAFILGNSPYDLIYMDVVWTPKFAAAGWLLAD